MEFLRDILGDALYAEVQSKLKGQKDVKLANLADGGYVSREKFLAVERQTNELQNSIANTQSTEALHSTIEKLQAENNQAKSEYEAKLLLHKKDAAIASAITSTRAKNERAVRALLDESKIVYQDGKVTGLSEQLGALSQTDGYLFDRASDTGVSGNPSNAEIPAQDMEKLSDKDYYKRSGF